MSVRRDDRGLPGALVISLDFELHWGVRDHQPAHGEYRQNLLGAREAIPEILDLFEEFEIAATWATVGFLFARDRTELNRFKPAVLPRYEDARLDPYQEGVGSDERDDPLHFAGSLIERIRSTPGQEIATHTFSHYFCCEPGQDAAGFRADIEAAVAIAREQGIALRSIVFPRNQFNESYTAVLTENGISAYRGNPPGWMWRFQTAAEASTWWMRLGRVGDAFLPLGNHGLTSWSSVLQSSGLADVAATQFLRPHIPWGWVRRLHARRLRGLVRGAARSNRIVHLWWHPHNFGRERERCLGMLRAVLEEFAECRRDHGMLSLSMSGVADRVRPDPVPAAATGVYADAD